MSDPIYPPPGRQPAGQAWGAPPWGVPPPQPKKTGVGKMIGFGCLGLVGVITVLSVVGALIEGSDSDSSGPAGSAPAGSSVPTAASEPAKDDGPAKQAAPAEDGPEGDVEVTGCEVADFTNWPSAEVTITNRSSKTSNYIVQVEFLDGQGTRLGDGTAWARNLDPGQAAKETAQGFSKVSGAITCEVADVTRYASR